MSHFETPVVATQAPAQPELGDTVAMPVPVETFAAVVPTEREMRIERFRAQNLKVVRMILDGKDPRGKEVIEADDHGVDILFGRA